MAAAPWPFPEHKGSSLRVSRIRQPRAAEQNLLGERNVGQHHLIRSQPGLLDGGATLARIIAAGQDPLTVEAPGHFFAIVASEFGRREFSPIAVVFLGNEGHGMRLLSLHRTPATRPRKELLEGSTFSV